MLARISPASAAIDVLQTRAVDLCFRFGHNFQSNGGDFPDNAFYKARGVRFRITDSAGVETYYNADVLTGCRTVGLDKFDSHTIRVFAKATFEDGNTVRIMNDEVNKLDFGWTATTTLVPNSLFAPPGRNPSVTYTWPAVPGGVYTPNIATVMSALVKTFTGHSMTENEDYRLYINQGPCPGNSLCFNETRDPAGPAVWLNGALTDKFAIVHEVGHLAAFLRFGGRVGSGVGMGPDYSLPFVAGITSYCPNGPGHFVGDDLPALPGTLGARPLGSEEYDNAAFNEGFAQYVGGSVWNKAGEANCSYRGLDCYEPGSAFEYCYTDAGLFNPLPDTGFERDWLAALYAIERSDGCGIGFSTIVDIVETSAPLAWANGVGKDFLQLGALVHLSGADLDCFVETLEDRIR